MSSNNLACSDLFISSIDNNGNIEINNPDNQSAESTEGTQYLSYLYPQQDLLEYLENCTKGKEILTSYLNNKKKLLPCVRSQLVQVVIARELDHVLAGIHPGIEGEKIKISTDRLCFLSSEIERIFNGEVKETYFRRGFTEGDISASPSGKLYYHYIYRKGKLEKWGVVKGSSKSKHSEQSEIDCNANIEDNEKLNWLKVHVDPWHIVCTYWTDTFEDRRKLLATNLSIQEYFNIFPCLQIQAGSNLLKEDFGVLYPGKEEALRRHWDVIKRCIIDELKCRQIRSNQDKSYILSLETLSPHVQDALVLHLLPYVITPFVQKRKRKEKSNNENEEAANSKSTIDDRRNQFFVNVKSAADVRTVIGQIKESLRKKKLTFQPMIIGIGDLTNIQQYLVYVNDYTYEAPSCLDALNLAMNIYFSVDCQYPPESSSLWIFIQKCGYNISLKSDRTNSSLDILIGRIKRASAVLQPTSDDN